jgi:uncharacterized repeat protein (TIGR02543 family)/LPXTG-motif cell wall-anchored protein
MKKFSLKALGAALLAAGMVFAGVVAPAQAATINTTVNTFGQTVGTNGTNSSPIRFTTIPQTVGTANEWRIQAPTGWSAVDINTICNNVIVNVLGGAGTSCTAYVGGGNLVVVITKSSGTWGSVSMSAEFSPGSLNLAQERTFTFRTTASSAQGTAIDTSSVTLAGGVTNYTVTFDANGGSGAMADQSGSTATALSSNAFTRSGYTFAGWNSAADGSGTAYADGASYAFTSSTTLFAQWTPTLATTGFESEPYLYTAFALVIAGAALMLLSSRRKQDI